MSAKQNLLDELSYLAGWIFANLIGCQACQRLWLVASDDALRDRQFTLVHHTTLSKLPTTLALAVATASHDLVAILIDEATIVPVALYSDGYAKRTNGRTLGYILIFKCNKYVSDFVSHRRMNPISLGTR